jgi:ATP-dependent protease ClpP protease subunit
MKLLASNRRQENPRAVETEGEDSTLYIYDAIVSDDYWGGISAQTLVPQIRAIKGGTLHLRINSPGGDVFAAQAIVVAIRDTGAKVIAHIDGYAASAATVIANAADDIEISDGAMYMIHCAWTMAYGNANDIRETAALLDKIDSVIAGQYAKRSGQSAEAMKALMDAETWFTAQEAVDAGLVNRIAEDAPAASAQWDLSAYARAPAPKAARVQNPALAPAPAKDPDTISNEHRERQQQRLHMLNRLTLQ